MENTLNTGSVTVTPAVELKLYPKKDGTWGWRWHDGERNINFGPTFDLMSRAYVWFDSRNESNETDSSYVEASVAEPDDVEEDLCYEPEELAISNDSTETFSDVEFEEDPNDRVGNR